MCDKGYLIVFFRIYSSAALLSENITLPDYHKEGLTDTIFIYKYTCCRLYSLLILFSRDLSMISPLILLQFVNL